MIKESSGLIKNLKDGIAEVSGLVHVQSGELVISIMNYGLVLNLHKNYIGVVFLNDLYLKVGSSVNRMKKLFNVDSSYLGIGKVYNSLGINVVLDVLKDFFSLILVDPAIRLIETIAPNIIVRQSVYESFITGTKVIDSVIPIGLGQRELVIGDRQTGKTTVTVDSPLLYNVDYY